MIKTVVTNVTNNYDHLSARSKWELFKIKVKEKSITYSVNLQKDKKDAKMKIEIELNDLTHKAKLNTQQIKRKHDIENELNHFYNEAIRGAQVRARVETIEKGEANLKYFDSIESYRQSSNVIYSLKSSDNKLFEEPATIIKEMGHFYNTLYSSNQVKGNDINEYLSSIGETKQLSEQQKLSIEEMPQIHEFEDALKRMKENKSPGYDGIPVEFYKEFWNELTDLYVSMIKERWENGSFPVSFNTGIISLIHKNDQRDDLKNYRPITLTNCDYKILAFVFAERLQNVISSIVHTDQVGYIRQRFIGYSIRNIIVII